jgi:predicted nucleotidyltransferase
MLDITAAQQRLVQVLIGQRLPGVTAVAFGSRVHGWPYGNAAKPWSDLDLALFGLAPADELALAHLRADLEDSALPWRVDLTDALDLSPTLRALVEQRGYVLQAALAAKEATPNP